MVPPPAKNQFSPPWCTAPLGLHDLDIPLPNYSTKPNYPIFDIPVLYHPYLSLHAHFVSTGQISRIEKLRQKVLMFKNLADNAKDGADNMPTNIY